MPGECSTGSDEPTRFIIGGVGHRVLSSGTQRELLQAIERALTGELETNRRDAASALLLISVADGADRLIIQAAARLGIPYTCVLPCSPGCFEEDFLIRASVLEFRSLLEGAQEIVEPPQKASSRLEGYSWVNELIVERANVLLAVWNGEPAKGAAGTANSVALATRRGCPVLWISSQPPHDAVWLPPAGGGIGAWTDSVSRSEPDENENRTSTRLSWER